MCAGWNNDDSIADKIFFTVVIFDFIGITKGNIITNEAVLINDSLLNMAIFSNTKRRGGKFSFFL